VVLFGPLRGVLTYERNHVMTEHPILFTAQMVRAVLNGTKTQTRRVVKRCLPGAPSSFPVYRIDDGPRQGRWGFSSTDFDVVSPYGGPGDRLWVRETLSVVDMPGEGDTPCYIYTADERAIYDEAYKRACQHEMGSVTVGLPVRPCGMKFGTVPSIHMPRWASRITLEVTSVRVERVQAITEKDVWAEGFDKDAYYDWLDDAHCIAVPEGTTYSQPFDLFAKEWTTKRRYDAGVGWDDNPWVFRVEFKRIDEAKGATE